MVEQNEFSKAALRGLTKYLMSKEKEDMERKLTDKERAEQWLDKLIENNKQIEDDLQFCDSTGRVVAKSSRCKNTITLLGAEKMAELIGVPVFRQRLIEIQQVSFVYNDTEFVDHVY